MLTKHWINFSSKYCRKDGNNILNQQKKIIGDLKNLRKIQKLQKEMEKYIEAPSYLKRELAETVAILEIKQYQ